MYQEFLYTFLTLISLWIKYETPQYLQTVSSLDIARISAGSGCSVGLFEESPISLKLVRTVRD